MSFGYKLSEVMARCRRAHESERTGDRRKRQMWRDVRGVPGWHMSSYQYSMFSHLMASSLQFLYDEEWANSSHDILAEHGQNRQPKVVVITARRRQRKTETSAIFMALLFRYASTSIHRVLLVAMKGDQAEALHEGIKRWVAVFDRIHNTEMIVASGRGASKRVGYYRKTGSQIGTTARHSSRFHLDQLEHICVMCYSSYSERLRGRDGQIIFVDEAVHIDKKCAQEVLTPMLSISGSVLYTISSTSSVGRNTELFGVSIYDDDKDVETSRSNQDATESAESRTRPVNSIRDQYRVMHVRSWCKPCIAQYKADAAEGACKHLKFRAHNDEEDLDAVIKIMGQSDRAMREELLSMPTKTTDKVFDYQSVVRFCTQRKSMSSYTSDREIYLFIDPTNGSESNIAAIGCIATDNGMHVVLLAVHAITFDCTVDEQTQLFARKVARELADDPRVCNRSVYLMIERNSDHAWVSRITKQMTRHMHIVRVQHINTRVIKTEVTARCFSIRGKAENPEPSWCYIPIKDGLQTTNSNKRHGVQLLSWYLNHNTIWIDENVILIGNDDIDVCNLLQEELTRYREIKPPAHSQMRKSLTRYTGKEGDKTDDMATSLLLLAYWTSFCRERVAATSIPIKQVGQLVLLV